MTDKDCNGMLKDLRMLENTYRRLLSDPKKSLYNNNKLKNLLSKCVKEVNRLEELMFNMELEGDDECTKIQ